MSSRRGERVAALRAAVEEDAAAGAAPATVTRALDRWRLLRLVLGAQGLYYLLTGLWPFLARALPLRAFFSATRLGVALFPSEMALALTVVIGAVLALAALRRRPDGLLVGLGAGAALAYALVEFRFRTTLGGRVWPELALEAVFILVLLPVYAAARLQDRRHGA